MNTWYYYDPDHTKTPKHGAHCVRCGKGIKDVNRALKVELHPENPWLRISKIGCSLLGPECTRIVFTDTNKI